MIPKLWDSSGLKPLFLYLSSALIWATGSSLDEARARRSSATRTASKA